MIQLHAIRKAFNQGHDNEYRALDGIDLNIEANKVTALRGPSGSGKTTLLTHQAASFSSRTSRTMIVSSLKNFSM